MGIKKQAKKIHFTYGKFLAAKDSGDILAMNETLQELQRLFKKFPKKKRVSVSVSGLSPLEKKAVKFKLKY